MHLWLNFLTIFSTEATPPPGHLWETPGRLAQFSLCPPPLWFLPPPDKSAAKFIASTTITSISQRVPHEWIWIAALSLQQCIWCESSLIIRICGKHVDFVNFLHRWLRDEANSPISIISKSVWSMNPHGMDTGKQLSHEYFLIFSPSLTSRDRLANKYRYCEYFYVFTRTKQLDTAELSVMSLSGRVATINSHKVNKWWKYDQLSWFQYIQSSCNQFSR